MVLEGGVGQSHARVMCRVRLRDPPRHETDHRSNKGDKTVLQSQQEILARLVDFSTLATPPQRVRTKRKGAGNITWPWYSRACLWKAAPGDSADSWRAC